MQQSWVDGVGGNDSNLSGQNSYPHWAMSPAQRLQLFAKAPAVFLTRQILPVMSEIFLKQKWNMRRWKITPLLEDVFPCFGNCSLKRLRFSALWISPRSVKIYISLQKPTRWLPVLLVISPPCHASHWEGKWLTGSKANWIHWITRWKRAEVSHHRIPRSAWGSTTPRPLQPEEKEPCFLISCSEEDHLQQ